MSFVARTLAITAVAMLVSAPTAYAQMTPKSGTTLAGGDNGHMAKKSMTRKSRMKSGGMMMKKKKMM